MTKKLYLSDSYLDSCQAQVLDILETEQGQAVVLDQSCFYPQGGGQPSDTGLINATQVKTVRLAPDGTILHYLAASPDFEIGSTVNLEIDVDKRQMYCRLHTAGHLISHLVDQLNLGLNPYKGFHFPEGPYAAFYGSIESTPEFILELENKLNDLIAKDLKVKSYIATEQEIQDLNLSAPEGKQVRLVQIGDYQAMGCGGTHVSSLSEIGKLRIRKIKSKKGETKISYEIY